MKFAERKVMNFATIKGNLRELSKPKGASKMAQALGRWTLGDVGEVIGFWVLHKAGFGGIVKPLVLLYRNGDKIKKISCLISSKQIRQGLCLLPNVEERYYREKILTEEQVKLTYRWDFLALKKLKENDRFKTYPCLIEVKTQWVDSPTMEFKEKDCSKKKESGLKVFCLRILLGDNWYFEATLEEM